MEAMKMNLFVVLMVVLMAFSTMQMAAAADAPAPSPTSDASVFIPTFFASLLALAFGFFLWTSYVVWLDFFFPLFLSLPISSLLFSHIYLPISRFSLILHPPHLGHVWIWRKKREEMGRACLDLMLVCLMYLVSFCTIMTWLFV